MTNLEMFQLVSKIWCNNQDLMTIANCGKTKMSEIKREIRTQIVKKGNKLPPDTRVVPMSEVIAYLALTLTESCRMQKLKRKCKNSHRGNGDFKLIQNKITW